MERKTPGVITVENNRLKGKSHINMGSGWRSVVIYTFEIELGARGDIGLKRTFLSCGTMWATVGGMHGMTGGIILFTLNSLVF